MYCMPESEIVLCFELRADLMNRLAILLGPPLGAFLRWKKEGVLWLVWGEIGYMWCVAIIE